MGRIRIQGALFFIIISACHGNDRAGSPAPTAFAGGTGQEFRNGTWHAGVSAGGAIGHKILGGRARHDFLLGNLNFGRIVTETLLRDTPLAGSCEIRGEVFAGHQLDPNRYVAGLTPGLRYHFLTGTRLIPFVQGGAGISATDIRGPDLSTTFEFNLMCGGGVSFFVRPGLSLELEYRLFHLSNAGIEAPNTGVNSHAFQAGVSWWF